MSTVSFRLIFLVFIFSARRQKRSLRRSYTVKAVWNVFVDYARYVFILFCKSGARARETKPTNLYNIELEMCRYMICGKKIIM